MKTLSKNGLFSKGLRALLAGMVVLFIAAACSSPTGPSSGGGSTPHVDDAPSLNLANILLDNQQLAEFEPTKQEYTVEVDATVDSVTFAWEAQSDVVAIDLTGPDTLGEGKNSFELRVSYQGLTRIYTITIIKSAQVDPDNANLKSITVSSGDLNFSPSQTEYNVTVAHSVETITITAKTASEKASVTGEVTDKSINVGDNKFQLTVTAEDEQTTKDYTVTIRRAEEGASDNADLDTLSLSGNVELTPDFAANVFAYTAEVPFGTSHLDVSATSDDPAATVDGVGRRNLEVGENTITVTVTAANADTQKYVITITRGEEDNDDDGDVDVGITPAPEVITITFDGNVDALSGGESMTVTAATSEPVDSYTWYLNGDQQDDETSNTITLSADELDEGSYRVDLQVQEGSRLASEHFTFTVSHEQLDPVATPTFSVAAGNVTDGTVVEFSSATTDVTYYYTTDGTVPTTGSDSGSSVTLNGAVNDDITVNVMAAKEGMANSEVATATYTIVEVQQITLQIMVDVGEGNSVFFTGDVAELTEWGTGIPGTWTEGNIWEVTIDDPGTFEWKTRRGPTGEEGDDWEGGDNHTQDDLFPEHQGW